MKTTSKFLTLLFLSAVIISCQKEEIKDSTTTPSGLKTWETVIDGSSFDSYTAFETYWNYLYPWGSTHNGSAKMVGSSSDHTYIYLSDGVLYCKSVPVSDGNYNYYSGTVYAKTEVLVNDQYPNWEIKCDFQCESQTGTWPAFWLTGSESWPPESDIMEYKGAKYCWQNTYTGSWQTITTWVSSPSSWHTYRVWIQKTDDTYIQIHYYIDGVWKGQHSANFVGKPMWLIIDYQMEGSSGTPGPTYTTYLKAANVYVGRTKAY